jgi:hypothetical protein
LVRSVTNRCLAAAAPVTGLAAAGERLRVPGCGPAHGLRDHSAAGRRHLRRAHDDSAGQHTGSLGGPAPLRQTKICYPSARVPHHRVVSSVLGHDITDGHAAGSERPDDPVSSAQTGQLMGFPGLVPNDGAEHSAF